MTSSSLAVGRRESNPIAATRKVPCPTSGTTFTMGRLRSNASRYSPNVTQVQARFGPRPATRLSRSDACSVTTGAAENSQFPPTSVVTPCWMELGASGKAGSVRSAWECRSMNPGASANPSPSIRVDADAPLTEPTHAIRPALIPTSPTKGAAPLPS
jgi:hypothetical protein